MDSMMGAYKNMKMNNHCQKLHRQQTGFTLVELIVATAMVGVMVIGITNLFIAVDTTQRRTQRLEAATRAGEQQIESLRNAHYNSLTPGSSLDFTAELPGELDEPRSGIVEVTEPNEGIRRLDVRVTFRDGNADREVNLSAVIGNIGIGQ